MAVCNLIGEIEKETGTFITLSQYLEDLTQYTAVGGNYQISPSKFVCLNIDYKNHKEESSINTILQNEIENFAACWKNKNTETEFTPSIFKDIFWEVLQNNGFFTDASIEINEKEYSYINEIKFIGDINIKSYNEHAGMGYTEIYCYIPELAQRGFYKMSYRDCEPDYEVSKSPYLEGYEAGYVIAPGYYVLENYTYKIEAVDFQDGYPEPIKNFFEFNTIIPLYDICDLNGEKLFENIPMGVYFSGTFDDEGNMTNPIKKYVNLDSDNQTGSTYGLRICTRYVCNSTQSTGGSESFVEINNVDNLSHTLSYLAESQTQIQRAVESMVSTQQGYKELISIFKNSRANVPYVKKVGDIDYWFVNGRNLNIPVYPQSEND